ncbi:CPBP family intramembrane glutamic endopeptidase [Tissierella sp. Yu-01]|uniref:CPBP family intramembrane glutamic endopeptidase n=1 Tax=Tissierella sp. Yu-01 TaxID=3035694 RepID=UPI00240E6330|nr:CPBP family intramembrane glutamic endopeptidase [Tissierella sp. Yu-01]WFA08451.1 CPBP family intramembrane metalloprotease [Tissierella sp. Yu-01]
MRRNKLEIIILVTILLILMYIVDYHIQPGYLLKSIIKIMLFLIIPAIYSVYKKSIPIKNLFIIKSPKELLKSLALGFGIYIFIITCYFILKGFIDLDNIKSILDTNLSVNKDNFIYISLYISFINSLLEEVFFRGFIFFNLKKSMSSWITYSISAFTFSIYHVAILLNWFNPILFLVALIGLFIGGLLFNWLNHKNENIYNSWLVHMFANFAINTVGLIMYGII